MNSTKKIMLTIAFLTSSIKAAHYKESARRTQITRDLLWIELGQLLDKALQESKSWPVKSTIERAKVAIEQKADIHAINKVFNDTPIGWAFSLTDISPVTQGNIVKTMLKLGANPNFDRDGTHIPLLQKAFIQKLYNICAILLVEGANPNVMFFSKKTLEQSIDRSLENPELDKKDRDQLEILKIILNTKLDEPRVK